MKISAMAGQQLLEVTIERSNGHYIVNVDGVRHEVDAHKLEADFYSILTEGRSYEVSVEPRGDAYHVRHGAAEQLVRLTDPSRRAREEGPDADGPVHRNLCCPTVGVLQRHDRLRPLGHGRPGTDPDRSPLADRVAGAVARRHDVGHGQHHRRRSRC